MLKLFTVRADGRLVEWRNPHLVGTIEKPETGPSMKHIEING